MGCLFGRIISAALVFTLVMAVASAATAQEEFRETYSAFAVFMGTANPPVARTGGNATIQISVTRWTTEEERLQLFAALIEKGQGELVRALQKQKETGFVRVVSPSPRSGRPSERLRYAREFRQDGKRRLVLALDRPIPFAESVYRPRWRDYDISLITLDLDEEGSGEGQAAVGVRMKVDEEKKVLEIENFGSEPVRLTSVRRLN